MGVCHHSINTPNQAPQAIAQFRSTCEVRVKATRGKAPSLGQGQSGQIGPQWLSTRTVKSRVEANSHTGERSVLEFISRATSSFLTQEHSQTCMRTMHALCSIQRPCFWRSIKAAASFCRVCAQSRSPGCTGRGQAGAFPFPFLTLRGSFEGSFFTRKPPVHPALVAVTKRTGSRPRGTQGTELVTWRSSLPNLQGITAEHVESGGQWEKGKLPMCPLRAPSCLSVCSLHKPDPHPRVSCALASTLGPTPPQPRNPPGSPPTRSPLSRPRPSLEVPPPLHGRRPARQLPR